jgi:hypothetical protein
MRRKKDMGRIQDPPAKSAHPSLTSCAEQEWADIGGEKKISFYRLPKDSSFSSAYSTVLKPRVQYYSSSLITVITVG